MDTKVAPASRRVEQARGRLAWSRFDVGEVIGTGGMAVVHVARDREAGGRTVALKVIHAHLASETQLVERFHHEVRAHVGVKHPCVVEMIGWGRDEAGRLFMAMEHVDGPTLKEMLGRRRRFPLDLAVLVAARVAAGLSAAHALGLVHRDVKPANVMLTRSGGVKVADFGISKSDEMTRLTSTGNVIGTPAYMSPEQALGRPVDSRSDLFSLGVLLHEMLTGSNPFQADNPATTLQRVVHQGVRPIFESQPQTPARLEALVESLLAKDREARPATAEAVLGELQACAEEEQLGAGDDSLAAFLDAPERVARALDRRRAERHFRAGVATYDGGRGSAEGAIWDLFLATHLDPQHAQARTWLEQLSSQQGYNLSRRVTPRIEELEARLREQPDDLRAVMQLAKLHKAQGNFLQVIFYYKRARALRPPDRYTQNQIDTLVNARAASIICGLPFEPGDEAAASGRSRPAAAPAEPARAEGLGDFVAGLLSTGWGKAAAVAACVVGLLLVAGAGFDRAARASFSPGRAELPPSADTFDREAAAVARARELADAGQHEKAERVLRGLLEAGASRSVRSEGLFLLGDSLERQGRRGEALDVHGTNAHEGEGAWSLRSLERQAELFLVEDDPGSARAALETLADRADGERRLAALAGLADLDRREGRLRAAASALEALLPQSEGTSLHDDIRLALADAWADMGETGRAAELYARVRQTTDHRSDAHARAKQGLDALGTEASHAGEAGEDTEPPTEEAGVGWSGVAASEGEAQDAWTVGEADEAPWASEDEPEDDPWWSEDEADDAWGADEGEDEAGSDW